ncbi:Transposase InsI for insertion sequence element IS30A [Nocardia gamkensis]|uniref:IS30 family transposase n=1 Tax=Nocardia gamkensis TaxID=352869 RepID=A0A7X6KZC9_9NOCA|nr:IS30 family transposase [Nocardia gamkensis]NQE66712.1 Transposase InsI for insertion sequence element IS30A [Nocardia gamkensis]
MGVRVVRTRGAKRRLVLEAQYWELILSGVGPVEAAKRVGIGRKTGYRWWQENGGLPPSRISGEVRSDRYLSLLERQRIATLRERGLSIREVARRLGRAASTVSREVRRNTYGHDRGRYDADLAHARAAHRARRRRPGRLLTDPQLRAVVQAKLELDWSPQQISVWLRREYPAQPGWHVSHETIYQALYNAEKSGLSRALTKRVRTRRSLRRRRRRAEVRSVRFITPSNLIEARPTIVDQRTRIGDWEGDLIVGARNGSAIATLVDRRSRFVRLVHLPDGRNAEAFAAAALGMLTTVPAQARLTLTWDQGSEMARHDLLADLFAEGIYFAHPGSPWMRATNENTNGLLRQYFPKTTDLSLHSVEDLRQAEHRINTRPRRVLGWRTAAELFESELAG